MDGIKQTGFWGLLLIASSFLADCTTLKKGYETVRDTFSRKLDVDVHPPNLSHPETSDALSTERLLLMVEQPHPGDIDRCLERIHNLTEVVNNDRALLAAKEAFTLEVLEDIFVYHWCFYQKMRTLDRDLTSFSVSYEEKGARFFESMKTLWLLAQALDEVAVNKRYFSYLRERYVQISRDIFGRPVDIVAPPLDERFYTK
ncbi:MAG: hypothetical protein HYW48_07420 [Deltaproteobacteria bacterium]|nr:hypothetical protein [Deltaproteobacteria bacterium]